MVFGDKKIKCHHCGKKVKTKDYRKHLKDKHPREMKISDFMSKQSIVSSKKESDSYNKKLKTKHFGKTRK
jgi:phage FluMu protein Com